MGIGSNSAWFIIFMVATIVVWLLIVIQARLDTGYRDGSISDAESHED
jgi:hypothetical protein